MSPDPDVVETQTTLRKKSSVKMERSHIWNNNLHSYDGPKERLENNLPLPILEALFILLFPWEEELDTYMIGYSANTDGK